MADWLQLNDSESMAASTENNHNTFQNYITGIKIDWVEWGV